VLFFNSLVLITWLVVIDFMVSQQIGGLWVKLSLRQSIVCCFLNNVSYNITMNKVWNFDRKTMFAHFMSPELVILRRMVFYNYNQQWLLLYQQYNKYIEKCLEMMFWSAIGVKTVSSKGWERKYFQLCGSHSAAIIAQKQP
jgi:hypothetical protein